MAIDLTYAPLGTLCDEERGITYGIVKVGDFVPDGVPVVRGGDIRNGRVVFDNEKRVTHEISQQFRRTILRGGEIVVNLISEPGHTAVVPPDLAGANVSRDVAVIALNNRTNHNYVDYYLKSPMAVSWLTSRLQGSVTQKINLGTLRDLPIPMPPLDVQHSIAHILGILDKKIDVNRQMNKTLDAMARAIFKDWFVDFGPTRAKMAGRTPNLAPDIWSLFPDRLDEDGKPKGWIGKPLDQVADFLNGLALQKYPPNGSSSLPVIKIAQLRAGSVGSADLASGEIPPNYVVVDGDVLFSWSGSLLHRVWTAGRGALNQHLFKVTSKQFPKWFYFYWIAEHMPSFQATAASKATTMGHIQRHHLTQAATVVGSPSIMKAADQLIAPLFNRQIANDLESRTLATTRDLLLPKLMSGEVRVEEAETIVGNAT